MIIFHDVRYWMKLILDVRDIGASVLQIQHPLRHKNGERYYIDNEEQMKKMWKFINVGM